MSAMFEDFDYGLNGAIHSSVQARWERKAAEAGARTPGKAGARAPLSGADRFIPNRTAMDMSLCNYSVTSADDITGELTADEAMMAALASPAKDEYKKSLASGLLGSSAAAGVSASAEASTSFGEPSVPHKILAFRGKKPEVAAGYENNMRVLYSAAELAQAPSRKAFRHIPQAPERILDAPDLLDDYYLNLLDWSSQNVVAVALGPTVYLWNAGSGDIQQLCQMPNAGDYVSSVQWASDGKSLAVGTSTAEVQIWDCSRQKQLRSMRGHHARVGATAWNGAVLASGSRDTNILLHDVRIREHLVDTLAGHDQEVCGLKWSPSGAQLASGGNDNILNIWDVANRAESPLFRIDAHQAAVKALAWCPFQSNLLASGGGTADRCIKFWNTSTGACLNSIDTKSQVCALQWNRHEREILSSHGFSQNQLCVWKYPSMVKMAEMTGHTARALHLAQSPDGTTVVSGGADETLRFWRCFDSGAEKKTVRVGANARGNKSMLKSMSLR